MNDADKVKTLSAMAKAAKYGARHARQAIAEQQRRAAARVCSPAGFAAMFPSVRKKP